MFRNLICAVGIFACFLTVAPLHAQTLGASLIKGWSTNADTLRFTSDTAEKELTYENYQCDTVWVTTSFEFGDRGFSIDGDTAVLSVCGGGKLSFLVQHDPQHSALPESDRLIVKLRQRTFDTTSRVVLEATAPSAAVESGYASEGGVLAKWIADGIDEIKYCLHNRILRTKDLPSVTPSELRMK